MTINYGKREANSLTAADPGDTLYIPFASYNDSGDSEALSGLAVSDIEIFKNGGATPRATDSGYSLLTDTGQYGDRVGLYRFEISLFNTSDDPNFYAAGSQYHVAVDAVTIDGKTVRFFPAVFEIGREKVNVKEIDDDTGPADNLGRIAGDTGTQSYLYKEVDTGGIADAIWAKDIRSLTSFVHDTGIWASNYAGGRQLTSFGFDTGITDTVWRAHVSPYAVDTGSAAYAQGRLMAVHGDTGAAHIDQGRLGVITDSGRQAAVLDTGKVASAVWSNHQTRVLTAFAHDTGVADTVWKYPGRKVAVDTGIAEQVWREQDSKHTDTGSFGYGVNLHYLRNDTGAANRLLKFAGTKLTDSGTMDTGTGTISATVVTDTGLTANAAAIRAQTDKLQFDTGANELHADIRKVNNIQVSGAGTSGDEWGP